MFNIMNGFQIMKFVILFLIFHSFSIVIAKKSASPKPTAPKYFALLESMKKTYNETYGNVRNLNERLNTHFRATKLNRIENAKRSAFLGASFSHPNICPCMLRVPYATEPVDREPLTKDMLQAFSAELDKNLDDYLEKFNPNVFNAIYLDDNRFVNPRNHQKRLYINSNPTFRYLEKNVPAHFLCPRYPAPHIPVILSKLVKGQYNAIFTVLDYVLEFPNHFDTGLLKCSFVNGRKKYEHTFIL